MAARFGFRALSNTPRIDGITLWTTLPSAIAWLCLAVVAPHDHHSPRLPDNDTLQFATDFSKAVGSDFFYAEAIHWLLMVTAMMLPLLVVPIRQVAFRSYSWRRGEAVAGFLAGYAAIWIFAGMVCLGGIVILDVAEWVPASAAASIALLAAAAWQLSPFRAAAMRKCHRSVALAPRGVAADRDCIRYGLSHGTACVKVCLPLMLATMISMPGVAAAILVALLLYFERAYQRVYRIIPAMVLTCCSVVMGYSSLS